MLRAGGQGDDGVEFKALDFAQLQHCKIRISAARGLRPDLTKPETAKRPKAFKKKPKNLDAWTLLTLSQDP